MAPRFRRNIDRDLPAPDGFGFCRLLSRPLSDFVVSDFARYLARSWRTDQRSPLADVLGFHFRLLQFLACDSFRRSRRQRSARSAAERGRQFLDGVLHGLQRPRSRRPARLVHCIDCDSRRRNAGAHGATYLTLKTEGPVHDRCEIWAKYLWIAIVPLLAVVLIESRIVRPD